MISTSRKSVLLVTFLVSLFCGSLICISLVTNYWIESKPWRKPNPSQSSGSINFGLLYGRKELNVAFGLRPHKIIVADMIQKNEDLMSWNLWFITLFSICSALVCSGFSAFLEIINVFIAPPSALFSMAGIYLTNISSILLCLVAIASWEIQFQKQLHKNILPVEDLDNYWTSEGVTRLGFSFWLVPTSAVLHFFNILLLKWSKSHDQKIARKPINYLGEKSVGAIMLY